MEDNFINQEMEDDFINQEMEDSLNIFPNGS